jgi:potassium-transporting ATPase KdpC subunit
MLRNEFRIAIRFTIITAVVLGILYPLFITAVGHVALPYRAGGSLVSKDGTVIGSRLIGQSFTSDRYFHDRPSAAGNGYDATSSGGSNYAASNQKLLTRMNADIAHYQAEGNGQPVPIDLVTASGSGLDSDISPAAALYQVPYVAKIRHLPEDQVRALVWQYTQGPQFGVLGNDRVNVLALNMALDQLSESGKSK